MKRSLLRALMWFVLLALGLAIWCGVTQSSVTEMAIGLGFVVATEAGSALIELFIGRRPRKTKVRTIRPRLPGA